MCAKSRRYMFNDSDLGQVLALPPNKEIRSRLKATNAATEKAEVSHRLRINHQDLLLGFQHTSNHPMWKRPAPSLRVYNRWIVGSSNTSDDLLRHGRGSSNTGYCRLCEEKEEESREHLLTDCDGTWEERRQFFDKVTEISVPKREEYATPRLRGYLPEGLANISRHILSTHTALFHFRAHYCREPVSNRSRTKAIRFSATMHKWSMRISYLNFHRAISVFILTDQDLQKQGSAATVCESCAKLAAQLKSYTSSQMDSELQLSNRRNYLQFERRYFGS